MALPEHLEQQRRTVTSRGETHFNVNTVTAANIYKSLGVDNAWNEAEWKQQLKIVINRLSDNDMEFDVVNLDPAIANALRRILIAEIPTMAIEHVFYVNNTSIIADEVLAHRLGLIPLNLDPEKFEFKKSGETGSERNTVVFKLHITCKRLDKDNLKDSKVLSERFEWLPNGSEMPDETNCAFTSGQQAMLSTPAAPVHSDILVAKLRPGQSIDLEAHATKGTGAEHAKWSPVATAWYRLQPEVVLRSPVRGDDARFLADACPGLFTLKSKSNGDVSARVAPARGHERHLEKVRHLSGEERWRDRLELRRRKEHFIFTIESAGSEAPDNLFVKALDVLIAKCDKVLDGL